MPLISTLANASSRGYGMFGGGAPFTLEGNYYALGTVKLSATTSTVTFAGIPTGFKHLQVRYVVRTDMSSGGAWSPIGLRFNSDSGANYNVHTLGSTGASYFSEGYISQTSASAGFGAPSTNTANSFGAGIVDILDYQSTTKNKVIRTLNGVDNNGSGITVFQSSAWFSTAAINSMTFIMLGGNNGSNYLANTEFALYGVK